MKLTCTDPKLETSDLGPQEMAQLRQGRQGRQGRAEPGQD